MRNVGRSRRVPLLSGCRAGGGFLLIAAPPLSHRPISSPIVYSSAGKVRRAARGEVKSLGHGGGVRDTAARSCRPWAGADIGRCAVMEGQILTLTSD
ncbi:Hypothetical protein NTJ_08816 [Nesidiocoris tenuis]|uniref:Secreted protein n=1 Tax=Nesidiocoris tenuis TaxID=355587 RepID=A0ABN7AZU7_9HEMI|nr:Hypothetical protein NTJ_08816 [Nesidiocoris tenuis]